MVIPGGFETSPFSEGLTRPSDSSNRLPMADLDDCKLSGWRFTSGRVEFAISRGTYLRNG